MVVSLASAVCLHVDLVSRAYAVVLPLSVAAFVGSSILAALFGEWTLSVVLFLTYLVPALFLVLTGFFTFSHFVVWQAALVGSMMPRSLRIGWAFPKPWKWPLVLWALSIALSWPIVVAREFDFTTAFGRYYRVASSRAGIPAPVAVTWTLNVTCIAVIGLLWLDWLFATYGRDQGKRFTSQILWPLFAGCVLGSIVAIYQAFGHTAFLNPTLYGAMGRAAGTMLDGNVFGTITAMWLPFAGAVAFGARGQRGWTALVRLAPPACLGIALLATGSRTALLTGVVGTACLIGGSWRSLLANRSRALVAAGGLAVVIVGAILLSPTSTTSALTRVSWLIPSSKETFQYTLRELWDRAGYGAVAVRMIADHPLVGIGLGSFSLQVADVAQNLFNRSMVPDNAQNWYRHQFAETGLLGSLGWIVWTSLFVWMLARRRDSGHERPMVGAATGAAVGLGVTSLLGMPTQDAAVSITFVVFAFWCIRLRHAEHAPLPAGDSRLDTIQWTVLFIVLGSFLAGTAYVGWNDLRPPYRALRADWDYQYGFFDDKQLPQPFRWTERKAVDVFRVEKPWLELVIGAVAPDAKDRPVQVKVWRNHDLILRLNRRSDFSVTRYVRVPEGQDRMMMQVEVSRTWRPAPTGGADQRERGVAVGKWTFVDSPPPHAIVIQ